MSHPTKSLVKYNNPILISTTSKDAKKKKNTSSGGKKRHLPPVESKVSKTEDILNSILPPREWSRDNQLWVQYVSSTPSTRNGVITLQDQLDQRLQQQQARETGICPVREELYAQCFDEIIRQVTINCTERGMLLLRVRDEIRMTIAAYQTLYESSIAFGMRKALMAEHRKSELESKIKQLQVENEELEQQVHDLNQKCESIQKRETERREQTAQKHEEEVIYLKKANEQLKMSLENLLSVPSS